MLQKSTFLFIVFLVSVRLLFAQTPGTLDNFTDGNISASPTWNVISGIPNAATGELVFSTPSGSNGAGLNMYTDFTIPCQEWSFSVRSNNSSNQDIFRYFFILKGNSNPTNIAAEGYFIQYQATNGDVVLSKVQPGWNNNQVITQLNSWDGLATTSTRNIRVTLSNNGNFEVFVNGISRFTASDATFKSCLTQYQSIRIIDDASTTSYTYYADNFAYVTWPCTNPADGGTIGSAQTQCSSFDPAELTQLAAPQCYYGTLEYKWQQAASSASSFTDIVGETASTYNPGISNERVFYKRLTRVNCVAGAPWLESNVIPIYPTNVVTGNPVNDTVYNQIGDAIFGVQVSVLSGNTYQWQVKTNNSSSWTNISVPSSMYQILTNPLNNEVYLNVTNPTYSMHLNEYRCVITNACGVLESTPAKLFVLPWSVFSNNTPITCDGWNGSLEINITVDNVGILNTTDKVLRQINLKLGSPSCKKNMSTYSFWLTAPDGLTTYRFVNGFTTVSTPVWADIKFRDHPALEKISEYSTGVQNLYFPYKIGYYSVENDNIFIPTFSGLDANGTWKLRITENDATNSGISFEKAELIFGVPSKVLDITSINVNNSCLNATCLGADGNIIIGTNNGYSANDLHYPGTVNSAGSVIGGTDGCGWNGANNNSAWYYFFASSTTAYITISGTKDVSASGVSDIQSIVLNGNSGCLPVALSPATTAWTVPTGGCADNETINNSSYFTTNGGGVTSASQVYLAGITANSEFNLSNLIPGNRYYLYIDGNGNASSSFYIEASFGCQSCIVNGLLPVKFQAFSADLLNNQSYLSWETSSEINNQYFQVERSADGINWEVIYTVEGAGVRSDAIRNYKTIDKKPLKGINYYRIKQVNTDGSFAYSGVRTVNLVNENDNIAIFPNPVVNELTISSPNKIDNLNIFNVQGLLVYSDNSPGVQTLKIPTINWEKGQYLIVIRDVQGKIETKRVVK